MKQIYNQRVNGRVRHGFPKFFFSPIGPRSHSELERNARFREARRERLPIVNLPPNASVVTSALQCGAKRSASFDGWQDPNHGTLMERNREFKEVPMRWIHGPALFAAGAMAGIFLMQPAAAPQEKMSGLRLNHFGIYVKDLDESTSFYMKKLGFRQAFNFKDGAAKPIVYLQMSRDTFLELTPADATHPEGFS